MAEDDDKDAKTEEASEHRLRKAREEEGQVPLSQDVKLWILLTAAMFFVWMIAPASMRYVLNSMRKFIGSAHEFTVDEHSFRGILMGAIADGGVAMAFPFLLFMAAALAGSMIQIGFLFVPKRLELKWDNLNLFKKAKQIFSADKIIETCKSALKLAAVFTAVYLVIKRQLYLIPEASAMSFSGVMGLLDRKSVV
jgi:flagellar biosynthetic protein FlhB